MATRRPLKVGVGLPDAEGAMGGRTARWADLIAMARLAEDANFDSVWNQDHLLFRHAPWQGPDDPDEGIWECWSVLAALAAVTTRVELGPLVSCTSFRNPALLAKIADTVDEISGGRLVLGLSAGWHEPEYDAFGYPFDHRVSRFEEALRIVGGLLRDGRADLAGTYSVVRDAELRPRGPRRHGPPMMVGTTGERMLRLTAWYADGWNGYFRRGAHRPAEIEPLLRRVDAACAAEGRDPASLERSFAVYVDTVGDAPASDSVNVSGAEPLRGSAEELAALFRGYADLGIGHLQVLTHPMTAEGIERLAPVLEYLDRGRAAPLASTTKLVRFKHVAWEGLPKGKGWTRSSRLVLFGFDNAPDRLESKPWVGPGLAELRLRWIDVAAMHGPPYQVTGRGQRPKGGR